jgi:hypothetical protein
VADGTGVKVKGLKELQRDFRRISKKVDKGLSAELKQAAEPVKTEAQQLALGRIRGMPRTPRWAGMRIGVATGRVYVVPSARRRGGSPRPNLGGLLLEQMDAAVEAKQAEVLERMEDWLDHIGDGYGF